MSQSNPIKNCPHCGGSVNVFWAAGGRKGDLRSFDAVCENCDTKAAWLGQDGTRREAIREWNRMADKMTPNAKGELP